VGRIAAEGTAEFIEADYRFAPLPGVGHYAADQQPARVSELLSITEQHETLAQHQSALDRLRYDRRVALASREELEDRTAEIAVTLERFGLLAEVYESDVGRHCCMDQPAGRSDPGPRSLMKCGRSSGVPAPACG